MEALLIIDMQNAWLNNAARPCFDADGVIKRINRAARVIRQRGGKVMYIRHGDDEAVAGTVPWQVISSLVFVDGDLIIDKTACDPFADTTLQAQLETIGARTVFISGFATEFCVDSTIRATASRGFDVIALADAHTTGDRPHLPAASVVAHHNWIWRNMVVPANNSLKLRAVDEIFPVDA